MSSIVESVVRALPPKGNLRRYRIGILFNGNPKLVEVLLTLGHRTVVFSDSFHPLYRVYKSYRKAAAASLFDTVIMLETSLDAIPVAPESLDVLILSNGLIRHGGDPAQTLRHLKGLIRPGGTLIWPERSSDGVMGKLSKTVHPFPTKHVGPIPRRHLCRLSMAAGLREIGQIVVPRKTLPWVVTFGRVGNRPWSRLPS